MHNGNNQCFMFYGNAAAFQPRCTLTSFTMATFTLDKYTLGDFTGNTLYQNMWMTEHVTFHITQFPENDTNINGRLHYYKIVGVSPFCSKCHI